MSFRLKTILGIAVIEILLLSALVLSGLYYLQDSNERQLTDRADSSAKLFATMTADAVVALDLATLDALVEQALLNKGLKYVRVLHENGRVLAEGGDEGALKTTFEPDVSIRNIYVDGRFDVTHPIKIAGRTFGRIEMGIDAGSISTALAQARNWMLSVAGVEIVLVALFSYMLGSILTSQLKHLQRGAREVAAGNFGYQIDARGRDELSDTASSFNAMSDALEIYSSELETARRKAEAGRAKAESTLEDAIESLSQGIVIFDRHEKVLHMNSAYPSLYGEEREAVKHAKNLEEINRIVEKTAKDIEDQAAESLEAKFQRTRLLDNGRFILSTKRPTSTNGVVLVETDVTSIFEAQEKARQLELELMHAQKLESLGTLAGGIAHEINTPIQYIGDNLRFIETSLADYAAVLKSHETLVAKLAEGGVALTEDVRTAIEDYRMTVEERELDFLIEEAPVAAKQSSEGVEHVGNIVRAMKEFSHPSSKEMAPVDLNRVVERASVVCSNEWRHSAELNLNLANDLPMVEGLEGELNQVVLNLLVNAAQAIAEKGSDLGRIDLSTESDDKSVILTISDTGIGIPPDIQKRIFDPFFTTKDVGVGTGQGLAITRDVIVNKHDGDITFETSESTGTCFKITLPLAHSGDFESVQA